MALLSSCGGSGDNEYVAKEVEPFVKHFAEIAQSYGYSISPSQITISFVETDKDFPEHGNPPQGHYAAMCYTGSKRIYINKKYYTQQYKCWGRREDIHKLLFHEMAHCYLGYHRHNDNKVNGVSASIMSTKDLTIPEDVYSKNFKAYMDELFLGIEPTYLVTTSNYNEWLDTPHQLDQDFLNDMSREDSNWDVCQNVLE